MIKTLATTILILFFFQIVNGQVFHQQSFETEEGWSLSHSFDNGNNKFAKRDLTSNFPGLAFSISNADGNYVIGAENTNSNTPGAPEDGLVTLNLDEIDISGRTNIQCVVALAANDEDLSYDDRTLTNGDFVDFQIKIDGGNWTPIGSMDAAGSSEGNSALFHDTNFNSNGGEIGEPSLDSNLKDFVLPINATGSTLLLRVRIKMTESTEEIVVDNIRLRENTIDDTPPTIHSTEMFDNQNIRVFFNETMNDNANLSGFYTGIPNLNSVTLENNNLEAVLNYSVPLEIGNEYNLVIFGLTDIAGNNMATPFQKSFFFNPNQPDLVFTEIMYNDPTDTDTLEFIEIKNTGNEIVQMGGLILTGDIEYTFPTATLDPNEYILVARKPTVANEFYNQNFGNYSGSLPNNDGIIILRNTIGQNIDIVHYFDNLPWPPSGDGTGNSIMLVDPNTNNNIGNNWIASTNGMGIVNEHPVFANPNDEETTPMPIIQFARDEYHINETDGNFEVSLFIAASNNMPSSVTLSIEGGTSGSAEDIDLVGSESYSFPPNNSEEQILSIPVIDDLDVEGFEFLTITLSVNDNASLGLNQSTDILINDDEFTAPNLFINELQSNNVADITDESGSHEDWLEIFNPNAFEVDIAGYYLTDNAQNPDKHRIGHGSTATIIPPNAWLLFWADEDGYQGTLHTNFRLSSLGEFLALRAPDGITVIDQVAFPALSPDESYGRVTDGNNSWISFGNTTPNSSNNQDGINSFDDTILNIYPNPTSNFIYWNNPMDVTLYSMDGQEILKENAINQLDLSDLDAGTYILVSGQKNNSGQKIIVIN